MKFSGSLKFVLTVVGIILVIWFGWKGYTSYRLRNVVLSPIKPGRVNVIAISPYAGYKIIVANQIAYLAKSENTEEGSEMAAGNDSIANASRLPLRELIQTLQGDETALGPLLMRLNDWPDTDTAIRTPVWKKEDIELALIGDQKLKSKLEKDLNVTLQGRPLDTINVSTIIEGIMIDSPVPVKVFIDGKETTLVGRVREHYQPRFCVEVEERLDEKFNPPDSYIAGVYKEIADRYALDGGVEVISESLKKRIATPRLDVLVAPVNRVLKNTVVLLNEGHITSAEYRTYDISQNRKTNDITLGLTEDGQMRLWKYSHDHNGFQLLFIVDSIAIAAPKVTSELPENIATIRRVPSKELVDDAVNLLNEIIKEKK